MDRRYSFWKKNPSFALTVAYLYVSFLGALHDFNFYRSFGINFLRFAGPADYLTAAFSDAPIFLIGTAALTAGLLLAHFWEWIFVKLFGPGRQGAGRATLSIEVLMLVIVLSLPFFAWALGTGNAKGARSPLHLVDARLVGSDKTRKVTLLGNVGPYTFLYEPSADHVIAVLTSNLQSMEFSETVK